MPPTQGEDARPRETWKNIALIFFLFIYLFPIMYIFIISFTTGNFRSGSDSLYSISNFLVSDTKFQQIFTSIILPLLIGLSAAPFINKVSSLTTIFLLALLLAFFIIAYYMLSVFSASDVKELLVQADMIDPTPYLSKVRDSLVTAFTIIFGISVGRSTAQGG